MSAILLDVGPDAYHADPYEHGPSLNASVACSLLLETPAHAKQKHPKLADNYVSKHTDAMDEGTALHQMLLGDDRVDILEYVDPNGVVVAYDDYRTNAAKALRDASRAAGRVSMLRKQWDEIALLGDSLKQQVAAFAIDPPLFVDGMAEQTIMWTEGDIGLRARLDWLTRDYRVIDDLKKARTAQPRQFHRSMWNYGYDIKAAFYVRAVKAAFGVEPVFRWVAIEPDPPYAMSVHVLSPGAMHSAHKKVDLAIEIWRECLRTDVWPAYPQTVNVVDEPAWMREEEWEEADF